MINRIEFPCMGSSFVVEAEQPSDIANWFREVEGNYSRFRKGNELSMLNALPPSEKWVSISDEFYSILEKAIYYKQKTDSLFNPFLGEQLNALGYDRSFSLMEGKGKKSTLPIYEDYHFSLHPHQALIKKENKVKVDLGGLVKGWSVDKAFQLTNARDVYIDGGGDMRFSFQEPQVIGIMNPFDNGTDIAQLTIKEGALATSNVIHRSWKTEDGEHHHILNGKTGENPLSDVVQATVLAPTVTEAEVFAKVLCMMHAEQGAKWIMEKNLLIGAIIVRKDKTIVKTDKVNDYCEGVKMAW